MTAVVGTLATLDAIMRAVGLVLVVGVVGAFGWQVVSHFRMRRAIRARLRAMAQS